jgi:hypothetical protein
MCGNPIYDYEHILGIGETGDDPEYMTLLCSFHHREKTSGRLPVRLVQQANASPHNGARQFTSGHDLYFSSNESFALVLGNLALVAEPGGRQLCGLTVDGAVALGARIVDGHLRLDLNIRDLDNRPLLLVLDGVLRFALANWDVTYTGRTIRVRSGMGQVVLEMLIDAETSTITVTTADVSLNHVRIQVGKRAPLGGLSFPDTDIELASFTISGGAVSVGALRPGFWGISVLDGPRAYAAPPAPVGSFRRPELTSPVSR